MYTNAPGLYSNKASFTKLKGGLDWSLGCSLLTSALEQCQELVNKVLSVGLWQQERQPLQNCF